MENMVIGQLLEVYKGKKVFLTGHTGFRGSWLTAILNLLGAEVKGYSLETLHNFDLYNLIGGDNLCKSIIGDIRDKLKLSNELCDFQPDFVFHLAAQPLVRLSYQVPSDTFEINTMGVVNLLEAIRNLNKPCTIVMITTDKVYFNEERNYPYKENDSLGGYDPYSASKAAAELIIKSYRNSFFNLKHYNIHKKAFAVARAGNVIGGGDWSADRLLPDICKALGSNKEILIRNPTSIRPWQHVLEPLFGYVNLGANLYTDPVRFSDAYNFGPNLGDVLAVKEMVNLAIKAWGKGIYKIDDSDKELHEAGILQLDINKANNELNWQPLLSCNQAIDMTIEWYKIFFNNINEIRNFTEQQILNFIAHSVAVKNN